MLMDRLYKPEKEQVLYHYCSAETLQAILEFKTLRFTDINMLNDAHESKCGYSAFEEAATRLIKRDGIPDSFPVMQELFFDEVDKILSSTQLIGHPFISCFSLNGDNLGQWRAYADDGRGFAIGFKASELLNLPLRMLKVEYDRETQIKEMIQALLVIFMRKQEGISKDDFLEDCFLTGTFMTGFKHSAFYDEQEIRCLHAVNVDLTEGGMRFVDPGGQNDLGQDFEGRPIKFQVRDNHLSAYLDIPFFYEENKSPIVEIVLGPKNHSNFGNIQLYLGGLGYTNIMLRQSTVPYR